MVELGRLRGTRDSGHLTGRDRRSHYEVLPAIHLAPVLRLTGKGLYWLRIQENLESAQQINVRQPGVESWIPSLTLFRLPGKEGASRLFDLHDRNPLLEFFFGHPGH